MLRTDVNAVASQITFGEHFLRDKRLVGKRVGAFKGKPCKCWQTPVIHL